MIYNLKKSECTPTKTQEREEKVRVQSNPNLGVAGSTKKAELTAGLCKSEKWPGALLARHIFMLLHCF